MKIKVVVVAKSEKDKYEEIIKELSKNISQFAKVESITIFNKEIAAAQNRSQQEAQKMYTKYLEPHLSKGLNIALDVEGKRVDSFKFSEIFNSNEINFFIGGAYGFERSFLTKCQMSISLSDLTFSHKIAKVVLYEQIFRGLAIKNNHPYHK
jgi:23S rRNA (pseudouridine1915-N3)-methyltransferase